MLVIFPKAGDYSGQVLPDHVAVHVQDLLRQQEQLIVTLGVLQTLEILPGRLSEGRVVPGAGRLLDRGVEPGAGPALVELAGVGVGVGSPGHADRPHHGELPSHIPVLTAWSIPHHHHRPVSLSTLCLNGTPAEDVTLCTVLTGPGSPSNCLCVGTPSLAVHRTHCHHCTAVQHCTLHRLLLVPWLQWLQLLALQDSLAAALLDTGGHGYRPLILVA